MPTFARLVGAILLAGLGVYVASLAKPYLPAGEPAEMLLPVTAVMGLLVGWLFTGKHLERGQGKGAAIGVSSALLLAVWVAFLFAVQEMVDRSMRGSYGGSPTHAVQDVFNILLDYTAVLKIDVLAAMFFGGVIVGVITSLVGKYTR
ncbi:MAG: TrgA family protein [Maritimibacter sp.]|nr:TrgA family protein [Maritimibacter sp.]